MNLSHRERVFRSLNWQETDRPPVNLYATPEIYERLQQHFGATNVHEALDIDFRWIGVPYRGPVKHITNGLSYDLWGIGYRNVPNGSGGIYEEAVDCSLARLTTLDDVESYPWPSADDFDYSSIVTDCEKHRDYIVTLGGADIPDIVNGVSRGRGMDQVLIDIVTRDEVGMAIIDKRVDFYYEFCKRALEAAAGKIDILLLGEDCGNQNGRMVSPFDFDEVFRPRIQKFIDLAYKYNARAMMHSCGDTHDIMPTFIEMGLDVLDAMQPEPLGMNPESIRSLCKGKLAFSGLISTQQTLPYGTVAQCRAEARHRLDVIAQGGGYIFAPAHCIQPDSPLENVLAIYEEALQKKLM